MSDKKVPPKKLSKKEQEAETKKVNEKLLSDKEKETDLPAVLQVVHKNGKKLRVNREYYLKNEQYLSIVEDDD